jgi:hypothetical protein
MMAEHICASHLVLDYAGLSEYDFENLKESIRELGLG